MNKIEMLCRRISNRECQSALKSGDLELAKNILRIKHQNNLITLRELKEVKLLCHLKGLYKEELDAYTKMIIIKEDIRETRRELIHIFNHELSLQKIKEIDCEKNKTVRFNIPTNDEKPKNKTSLFSCISGYL
ncbi:hypothetical protein [Grimontia hollisae]|uniref:Uncharacterized protein n=1 Tax=Grimontia hollisae TaxID=673 RepID=A0A377HPY3_GRIHO|nr:hypothetical protein [Grimontia hollisae]STO58144.1 Uncharacterised protein [Grimontia hollisae]